MSNFKDQVKKIEDAVHETSVKTLEHLKKNVGELQHDSVELANKTVSSVYMYFQKMDKKSILAFLLGFGGITIGAGLILVPGVGFVLGLLVGIFLEDSYRNKIKETLKNSSNTIVKTAHHLTEIIQKNWEKFMQAFHADMENIEENKESVERYAKEIEQKSKEMISKYEKK